MIPSWKWKWWRDKMKRGITLSFQKLFKTKYFQMFQFLDISRAKVANYFIKGFCYQELFIVKLTFYEETDKKLHKIWLFWHQNNIYQKLKSALQIYNIMLFSVAANCKKMLTRWKSKYWKTLQISFFIIIYL